MPWAYSRQYDTRQVGRTAHCPGTGWSLPAAARLLKYERAHSRSTVARYTVDCPVCPSTAVVELGDDAAIYRIEGYDTAPRRLTLTPPEPMATLGEKLYLDRDDQRRRSVTCENGHHLRVFGAGYVHVPKVNCLYDPVDAPAVDCPHCAFRYGTHEAFIHEADTERPASTHVLRSVTTEPAADHTEVSAVTRRTCTAADRLTVPRTCPHCGRQSYFNYRSLVVDPTVRFLDIEDA